MRSSIAALLVSFALGVCAVVQAQTVHSVETSSDLSRTLVELPPISFNKVATTPSTSAEIIVDASDRYQTMDGFGASLTDGAAWLLQERLPMAMRQQVMQQLFDPRRGAGLSFLRQPIGSTDLSRDSYSFDDMPAGKADPTLQHFSAKHDDAYVFPIIREALRLNPAITVMATPWSPPAWMKTGATMNGGQLREDAMAAYATYLVRSVQAFRDAGVPVRYLSVQNEPLNETKNYPGTLMPAAQAARLIGSYLGPDLRKAGLDTKVLAYDHNWDHPEYPITVLSDPLAAPYLAGTAVHCYGGDVSGQEAIHQRFPQEGIWLTECSGGTWQREPPLLSTAHLLIDATRHWAKSVMLWAVALDSDHGPHAGGCKTCRGLVSINLHATPATVTYNGDFYALAQASKFVLPGATRIGSTSFGREGLETVAFQNMDGTIALLVLNNGSESANVSVRSQGRAFATTLPAGALATYSWTPSVPANKLEAQ